MSVAAVRAVVAREMTKLFRQRGRLLSAMVRPLVWLVVIGSGVGSMINGPLQDQYLGFLVPGILAMTLLFAAMLSALTLVYDKEFGIMRMMLIAPIAHGWIVIAKVVAAVFSAWIQGFLLIVILLLIDGILPNVALLQLAEAGWFMLGMVCVGICCAAMGGLVAVYSKTLDNFAVIMNFFIFPVFFLSGALYPVSQLPLALKAVVLVNPFTYAVDLLKHAMHLGIAEFPLVLNLAVCLGFSAVAITIACWRFSKESVYEPMFARVSAGPKR